MKRSLLALVFLGTTALTPVKAEAGLLVGKLIELAVTAVVNTAISVGGVNAFTLGLAAYAPAIIGVGLAIGLNVLLNNILAPDQGNTARPSDRLVNFRQGTLPLEFVYGEVRKGGPYGFTGFNNNKRYYNIILASHETEGVTQHWLDERRVIVDTNDEVSEQLNEDGDPGGGLGVFGEQTGSPIQGFATVDYYDGSSGQAVDAELDSAFAGITSDHNFKGLSHTVITAKRTPPDQFSDVYPRGREWVYSATLKGINSIYDPRDESTGYSNNSALVIAHWIENYLGQNVDWDEVATEAYVCDETVTNKELGTQSRYTTNITLSDDENFESHRAKLGLPCDAFFYERTDGKVGFKVGRWIEPTVTLTEEDFFTLDMNQGVSEVDVPNSVSVVYVEPENNWREQVSAEYSSTESKSFRINQRPNLYGITNHNQAARINKRLLLSQRAEKKINGTIGLIGFELIGERFIHVEHSALGLDEDFEIDELVRNEQPGIFTFSARSIQESDFDFDATTEEGDKPTRSNPTNDNTIGVPTSVNATSSGNGTVTVTWVNDSDIYLTDIRVCTQDSSPTCQIETLLDGVTTASLSGFTDGDTYDVDARHRTASGRVGAWNPDPAETITVTNNSTAPSDLATFTATGSSGQADIDITTANDQNQDSVDLYRNTVNDFGTSTLIANRVLGPNQSETYTDTSLVADTYYYWGVPKNSSNVEGNSSADSAVVS